MLDHAYNPIGLYAWFKIKHGEDLCNILAVTTLTACNYYYN